jgi:myb proto-oncogene protein
MNQTPRKRNLFSDIEDQKLYLIKIQNPNLDWGNIAQHLGGRTAKQCKERWINKLDPYIKKGNWTQEEDELINKYVSEIGTKWRKISKMINGRCENDIKNRWYSYLSKNINQNQHQKEHHLNSKDKNEVKRFNYLDEEENMILFG